MTGDGVVFEWLVGGGMLAMVGFSVATYKQIGKIKDEEEEKRSRIYTRLDEVKSQVEGKFVAKDICTVVHKFATEKLDKIEMKLDKLLDKNGIK